MAKVGNKEKKKWLYAFNITPLTQMNHHELVAQPQGKQDQTSNRYDSILLWLWKFA